ncbi:MAG: ThiF family adenylyltransferase [Bradyrhizobium sp.]
MTKGGPDFEPQALYRRCMPYRAMDPQKIEASNLNRLVVATQNDVDNSVLKFEILRRSILGIRPWAQVEAAQANWQDVDRLIKDAQGLFGCVDESCGFPRPK